MILYINTYNESDQNLREVIRFCKKYLSLSHVSVYCDYNNFRTMFKIYDKSDATMLMLKFNFLSVYEE